MSNDQLNPELLTISGLFEQQAIYTVPIYQRNYAWRAEQIEQLISDIQDAMGSGNGQGYFLGNLVVTRRASTASENDFEVVDGQQRLTTLYLLLTLLEKDSENPHTHHHGRLQYESRARATEALLQARQKASMPGGRWPDSASSEGSGIRAGFKVIQQHKKLQSKEECCKFADFLRNKVTVVRASLPPQTDLNRYFEIMNTRGQQLKHVDIVKARLMSVLPESEHAAFAWIWEACADMDSYVQMSLTRKDTALRGKIFGDDWSWLRAADFPALLNACPRTGATPSGAGAALSLDEALFKYARAPQQDSSDDEGSERFRSPIEFPAFLLQVLKVKNSDAAENEGQLDDKRLIKSFTEAIPKDHEAEWVRDFVFTLLKCRNLFDSFILKRQFVSTTEGEEGDWSLQRLKKRISKGRVMPGYVHVFSKTEKETEEDGVADTDTQDVLQLQSMLRITYTSPRTMHWITQALQWLASVKNLGTVSSSELANLLRSYARSKVEAAFFEGEQPQGVDISRIVFTYLDYLLLDSTSRRSFKFQFRNSIEHFYPQHPDKEQSGAPVAERNLHLLGNLALVSVSANSKFSNNLPSVKASFKKEFLDQSLKLGKMAQITRDQAAWGDAQVQSHHAEMVNLLREDVRPEPTR